MDKAENQGKMVYLFEEGRANMKSLLGGKGSGLAEMTRIGLPVPPGMTITTEVCRQYYKVGNQIFKLLPLREEGGAWMKLLDTVILELTGMQKLFPDKEELVYLKQLKAEGRCDQARIKDISNVEEISVFAVVKDGKWYERGKMGWFAVVSDEKDKDAWNEEVKQLLASLPPDTLLTMYDCHI